MIFPRYSIFVFVVLAAVGATFLVFAHVTHDEFSRDVLGESIEPEGSDILLPESVQLPENHVKGAGLPVNESLVTSIKLTATNTNKDLDTLSSEKFIESRNLAKTDSQNVTKLPEETQGDRKNKTIVIHLKTQTMDVVENGEVLHTFTISSGKRGMQTPTGTFRILSKSPRAYSKTYGLYMPYWMAFTTRGHGIHELPEWPNGYKEGENHLGTPVSHGCVRLGVGPAKTMYDWAEIGTSVEILAE